MKRFIKRDFLMNKFQNIIWDGMGYDIFKSKVRKRYGNMLRLRAYRKFLRRPKPIFYKVEVMHVYKPKKKLKELMRIYYERLKFLFYYNKMKQRKMRDFLKSLKNKKSSLFKKFLLKFECRIDILLFKLGFLFNDFKTTMLFNRNSFCIINNNFVSKASYSLEVGDEVSFSFFWFLFLKNLYYLRFKKIRYCLKKKFRSKILKFQDLFLKIPKFIELDYNLLEFILVKFPTKYDLYFFLKLDIRKILVLFNYAL